MNFVNPYRIIDNMAIGKTRDGYEYIIDADNVEWLQNNYTCYYLSNEKCISARNWESKRQFHLSRLVLEMSLDDRKKVIRRDNTVLDYRRSNLWSGNDYILKGDYYEVICRNQKIFLIDADDYDLVSEYVWHVDVNGYVISDRFFNAKPIKQHRLIMGILDKPKLEVDHIYHNTTDNRKKNLRIVGRSENMHNIRTKKTNKFGCPGVELIQGYTDMWKAGITYKGKSIYLGCFRSLDEAIKARLDAEQRLGILRTE